MTEESLVAQNPRDEIILLREESLQKTREAKKLRALGAHDEILRKFSKQFFKNWDIFNGLNTLQKKELAEFCASHCRRWLAYLFLPIGSSLLTISFLGFYVSVEWFLWLLPWFGLSLIGICFIGFSKDRLEQVNIGHFWPFLIAYRKINQAETKNNKRIESGVSKNE